MKKISLGFIQMSDWDNKTSKVFPDFYYDQKNEWYEEDYGKQVAEEKEDEIILPANKEYTLTIDYPLSNPFKTKWKTGKKGITRRQAVDFIVKCYNHIYQVEDGGKKVPMIPGMLNRITTNGMYGIWGHDLGDLILHTLIIKGKNLEVSCDS